MTTDTIEEAAKEEFKKLFGVLVDNLATKAPAPETKFARGLRAVQEAKVIALSYLKEMS